MNTATKEDHLMPEINKDHRNEYALITGATSGIGYELAKLFAADGYSLILVARNEERLNELSAELKMNHSVEVTPIAKNLFLPGAAKEIYDQVKSLGITVNVLVNDAGQGEWGPFVSTPLERELDIIQLNIVAVISLTKYFVQDMVARNEGKILQLGSEASATPAPLLSVYAATKAFVLSFSTALSDELKDTNVTITVLMPGATDTDFFHKARSQNTVTYQETELLAPGEVARDGYSALMKGESKIISGGKTRMHVFMSDLLGGKLSAAAMRKKMKPTDKEKTRGKISHDASRKERGIINNETGRKDGDYNDAKDGEQ